MERPKALWNYFMFCILSSRQRHFHSFCKQNVYRKKANATSLFQTLQAMALLCIPSPHSLAHASLGPVALCFPKEKRHQYELPILKNGNFQQVSPQQRKSKVYLYLPSLSCTHQGHSVAKLSKHGQLASWALLLEHSPRVDAAPLCPLSHDVLLLLTSFG